ncbi:MAG TPA: FkbM family methyltransferase [Candidatus Gastranaerophilaceae bacterium]|nr:FkbM family methyltransferase [Candidatus Gastranaerophilaceae bacterium]HPT40887.1 FkbM family methyltransferase [Candidatus Gastranaerophilaceae bacterium]
MRLFKKKRKYTNEFEKIFEENKVKKRFVEQIIEIEGYKFKVPDAVSFAYQIKDIFLDEVYKFKPKTEAPLIYDCGANVGTSILYFKREFPNSKIKAFEADEKIHEYLIENIKDFSDVEVYHKAVWVNNDNLCFNSEGADAGSIVNNFDCKQTVKALRLKELLQKESEIDFLKMDIEGAETDVIIDCAEELKKVKNVFIEYHSIVDKPQTLDKILSIITNAGFRYHLQNISNQQHPFIERNIYCNMDLQVNIFGYRS